MFTYQEFFCSLLSFQLLFGFFLLNLFLIRSCSFLTPCNAPQPNFLTKFSYQLLIKYTYFKHGTYFCYIFTFEATARKCSILFKYIMLKLSEFFYYGYHISLYSEIWIFSHQNFSNKAGLAKSLNMTHNTIKSPNYCCV